MTLYARGASFERAAKKKLEKDGAFVIRSAGSHGAADLIAFWPTERIPWLIQCKTNGILSKKDKETLISISDEYRVCPVLCHKKNKIIEFDEL